MFSGYQGEQTVGEQKRAEIVERKRRFESFVRALIFGIHRASVVHQYVHGPVTVTQLLRQRGDRRDIA